MSRLLAQGLTLLGLRLRVTWRTYTATFQARLESLLFLPAVLLLAYGIQEGLYFLLTFALDPHIFFRSLSISLVMLMHVTLLFLWLGWSVVPALGFRTNEALDLRRLQLLPIRFPGLLGAAMVGFGGDLSTILPISFCIGIGRFVAEAVPLTQMRVLTSEDVGWLVLILTLFLLLILQGSMLVVQLFQTILPKVDLTRILLLTFAGILAFVVALNLRVVEYPDGLTLFDDRFIDQYNALPTGPLALAIHELALGNVPLILRFTGQAALWVLGLACVNALLLWIAWSGRFFGLEAWLNLERLGIAAGQQGSQRSARGWPLWMEHPAIVTAWKDVANLVRNRHFFFYKTLPGILAPATILLAGKYNLDLLGGKEDLTGWFVPLYLALTLFIFVTQANLFVANFFGFERDEIGALLITPVPRRQIILGKNLFFIAILLPDMLFISTLSLMLLPHPTLGHWLLSMGTLSSISLLLLGLGSLSSVLLPYFTPLDRPVITLQGAMLVGLANTAILVALAFLMIPALLLLAGPWLWWKSPVLYAITIPVWVLWVGGLWYGLVQWASRLMPDYEEWIQLRVRGIL